MQKKKDKNATKKKVNLKCCWRPGAHLTEVGFKDT